MLRTTEVGELAATWRIAGDRIAMESLTGAVRRGAYRVLIDGAVVDAPEGASGTVYFGCGENRPDLVQVRDWFPEYGALWDAVRAQYWDAVLPLHHRRFRALGGLAAGLRHH